MSKINYARLQPHGTAPATYKGPGADAVEINDGISAWQRKSRRAYPSLILHGPSDYADAIAKAALARLAAKHGPAKQ